MKIPSEDAEDFQDIPPEESSLGWSIGDEEPCSQPLESPQYTDHSALFGSIVPSRPHVLMGSVSLVERGDTFLLASTSNQGVRWWTLDGLDSGLYSTDNLSSQIALQDLDGDGVDDLLRYSTFIEIAWSFGTEEEYREPFFYLLATTADFWQLVWLI